MSVSYVITPTLREGNNSLAVAVTKTQDGQATFSGTLATGVSNQEISIAFTTTNLEVIYISTTQDLTLETNSGSAADDTISLKANVPFLWMKNSGIAVPFVGNSGAITKLFLSNASGSTATIEIRVLKDTSV